MDRNLFLKIATTAATQGGNYIRDGKYRLVVDHIEIENKTGGAFYIAEFIVEAAQKVAVASALTGQTLDVEPNAVGTRCSTAIPLNNPKIPSGPGNCKAQVLALLGYEESQVKPEDFANTLEQLRSAAQPARGMFIDCETYRKKTKAGDKELTLLKWTHVPPSAGNDKDSIAARRAKLESRAAAEAQSAAAAVTR